MRTARRICTSGPQWYTDNALLCAAPKFPSFVALYPAGVVVLVCGVAIQRPRRPTCAWAATALAPAPHTNRAPQTNQYMAVAFCAICFHGGVVTSSFVTEIHGRATNLAQTLLHALLWVCLRLALVRQLIAVRCGHGNMVLAARFGGDARG